METSGLYKNIFIIRKMILDAENIVMQNTCIIKWMKYRNVPPKLKNANIHHWKYREKDLDIVIVNNIRTE